MPFVRGQSGNPAGKPRGARNRSTIERERVLQERINRLHNDLGKSGATAHDVLVAIYQHPDTSPEMRLDAAKAAIRFEIPALAAQQVSGTVEVNVSLTQEIINAFKRADEDCGPIIDLLPLSEREERLSFTEASLS